LPGKKRFLETTQKVCGETVHPEAIDAIGEKDAQIPVKFASEIDFL
jgi:hypothetical protein